MDSETSPITEELLNMKTLAFAAVCLSITSMAAAAETNQYGDLIIRTSPQPPTAAQLRADPKLRRYPGLTPLEHNTANQHRDPNAPAAKSACYTVMNGNTSSTVCY
jgi:hypothetical protein